MTFVEDVMIMNFSSDHMANWLASSDSKRANLGYNYLMQYLESAPFSGTEDLLAILKRNPTKHISLFRTNPSICKAIERLMTTIIDAEQAGHNRSDIRLVQCASAMMHILLIAASEHGADEATVHALAVMHNRATKHYLSLASGQADAFCQYLQEIAFFFEKLALNDSRIFLVELPVGNSLAVKLLTPLLERNAPVTIVRGALSRNDSKKCGITRCELLAERFKEAKPRRNDVVLYMDEWDTGSNFNNLCKVQKKVLDNQTLFFPAAILTKNAKSNKRYATFRKNHDSLLDAWSMQGERFRKILPPLPSMLKGGYFFWSENDRIAGYRKMQIHGAIFSSLDTVIETFRRDDKSLLLAIQIFLGEQASEHDLPGTPSEQVAAFYKIFPDSYEDYQLCKGELRKCADDFASGGDIEEFGDALTLTTKEYGKILNARKAKQCVILALDYLKRLGSLDPTNRYYFRTHAPVLIDLTGPSAHTHEIAMDFLHEKLHSISKAKS